MDQENLQSKGFFGILALSVRLIHSRRRLFLSLAAAVLLPLAALTMGGSAIATRIWYRRDFYTYDRRSRYVTGAIIFFLVYGIIYLFFFLLDVAAALHAAASAYAAKEAASLKRSLLKAAPRAWPRLLGTCFWGVLLTLVYLISGAFIFGLTVGLAKATTDGAAVVLRVLAIILACVVGAVYVAGALYVTALWHLSLAATVLEGRTGSGGGGSSCWGIAAIRKARALARGRVIMCCALTLLFDGLLFVVNDICWKITLYAYWAPLAGRIAAGAVILFGLTGLFLFGLTVLTVAYLVLKAWHGEAVDPVSLAANLDACAGQYERMVVPNGGVAGNV